MTFHRRDILKAGLVVPAAAALPHAVLAQSAPAAFAPKPGAWRSFEITTRFDIAASPGKTQAWVPLPSLTQAEWIKPQGDAWTTSGVATLHRDSVYGAQMLHLAFADGQPASAEIVSRFSSRDRAIDLATPAQAMPGQAAPLDSAERALYLAPTALIPTGGIVKETSDRIVGAATRDLDKARAIYEWVVDNTFRDANVRGCGVGDIAAMLKSGNLGGKCADLNALYVGLARAAGLPARDVYGIRVASSRSGYKSLGAGSEIITKAQHCRAEVWLSGLGWVPVDPADVRKVALEEPPANLALNDPKVAAARQTLLGAWEGNWLAYNVAHDIALPGSAGAKIDFLMYPQAETAAGRLDCLDPDAFRYTITARETTAA